MISPADSSDAPLSSEAQASSLQSGFPADLGYRMPAEWEPHEATWLSWPRRDGISFPGSFDRIPPILAKMVDALSESEHVCINVCDADHENEVREALRRARARTAHVSFHRIPINEPWCRDHGPIFVKRDREPKLAVVDWDYNAWGWKYPPFDHDDAVPEAIATRLGLPRFKPGIVMEGGSIDVNGRGSLLTTRSCLLNLNRNPDLTKTDIERMLSKYLNVSNILWLGEGIEGDDTDGHIDDITRFVTPTSVVTCVEDEQDDPNYEPLQENLIKLREMNLEDGSPLEVHTLPMPGKVVREGERLPASYANFYIANKVVLLPTFNDNADGWATSVLQNVFPDRKVVGIDCRELIWGLGAFHCLTQQQPKA
ncbi:MAG TPA: agmatine deiminase family protein [Chthoniobacteraceae bacterium]|nr:agmatine deiminase family protein [Chthoniobacteraceae bacterium]